jgi:hypothetical protein
MNRKTARIGVVVLVVAAVAVFLLSRSAVEKTELPPALGTLRLEQTITGSEASAIVNRMHGKGVTPKANAIGVYKGASGTAMLYLSVYEEPRDAAGARNDMIAGIRTGRTPFSGLERRTLRGHDISSCIGQGQAHYFFAVGRSLYWLAVDFPVAAPTLEALLSSR